MSKENLLHSTLAIILAGISAYLQIILIPFFVLIITMAIDYITGLINAKVHSNISSRIGIIGIVKKVCYIALVGVGIIVDYIFSTGMQQLGISYNITMAFGLLVTIWLIINELISILENLSHIGVPLPKFLTIIVKKLKTTVEDKIE